MAVQLSVLAVLTQLAPAHYLYASTAAVEAAVLHNFVWHMHFRWRDRREDLRRLARLLRFHLSNGLVSVVGNLIVMRMLVQGLHVRIVIANDLAIMCCSVANFWLGDLWAFPVKSMG